MSESTEQFCRETVQVVAALGPILTEHLADFDEMLPHLYFGDVGRWACAEAARDQPSVDLLRLLDLLESTYPRADEDVKDLIDASFVENVQDDPAVVALFGPVLLSRVEPQYRPR